MKGGMVFFKGTGGQAARRYLEQDAQLSAAGYYTENSQLLATRTAYSAEGNIEDIQLLTPEEYQGWVEWVDPRTDEQRGTLKERVHPVTGKTEQSVMFVDKSINAPKSLSVLAAIDPQFATVLERTMGRAAEAIGRYQAQNLHTRIMRKGVRSWVPVERLESATVVHKTSREGDPFWHIHFQTLNRVYAGGKWRALDTAELVKHNATLNALGTAVMSGDVELRNYLVQAGYNFNPRTGEIEELAGFVENFSKRNQQINARKRELIALWEKDNPGQSIGVDLMNRIDHQAWADTRADKSSENSANTEKWATELADLGFIAPEPKPRSHFKPVHYATDLSPLFYREAAGHVLAVLSEHKSGWSIAAIKAQALNYCAEHSVVATPAVLQGITQGIIKETVSQCVLINPDIDPYQAPAHLPLLSSQQVIETESLIFDYTSALVARESSYELSYSPLVKPLKLGAHQSVNEQVLAQLFSSRVLTDVQGKRLAMPTDRLHRQALSHMAGTHQLVVVTGPAGAGKTTLLKASKAAVEARGGRQFIVAPSAKAAEVAQAETGAQTNTAHGLLKAFGYDFSTDEHGVTTWSEPDESHYVPRSWALRPGDQLVVDEAGMLSQDVAVRLYDIALKTGAQLVVTGDYAQLSAVGRGGVLQQCAQMSPVTTDLESVWRFRTATGEVDEEYARLSLKMRERQDAGAIFDALVARGAVVLHADEQSAQHALSQKWLSNQQAGRSTVVAASTNELVTRVNTEVALLRGVSGDTAYTQDIEAGRFVVGMEEQAITVGDIVRTRENDRDLGVLNGKSYVVRAITDRFVRVQSTDKDGSVLTLPVEYVASSVQLGYASTVHSSQGMTVDSAHLLVTGHTDAAGVYVGLTRGRFENVVHCVAADLDEAREQFVAALGREGADRGLISSVEELRGMLAGTDLEAKAPENYQAWAYSKELQVGDGLMFKNKKYLVAGLSEQGKVYAVPEKLDKRSKPVVLTPPGETVRTAPGGPLPENPKLTSFISKNQRQLEQAQRLEKFASDSKKWVAHAEANTGTVLQYVRFQHALAGAKKNASLAHQALETAQADFSQALDDHKQRLEQAQARYEQVLHERSENGFFKRLVTSNIPVAEAERAVEQVKAQRPSYVEVARAQAQVEACERAAAVAREDFERVSAFFGPVPTYPGWPSAGITALGDVAEPAYEDIDAQVRALRQQAVRNLRAVDGSNQRLWVQDAQRLVSGPVRRSQEPVRPAQPSVEFGAGFGPGSEFGQGL